MATKADLQQDAARYCAALARAQSELRAGRIGPAVLAAMDAWPAVDGMLRYVRKYEPHLAGGGVVAFDLVLQYAPVLFEAQPLEALAELLKTQKGLLKNDSSGLAGRLEQARRRLGEARKAWDYLERNPGQAPGGLPAALGGDGDWLRWLTAQWESLGFVRRTADAGPPRLSAASEFEARINGKCPACGAVATAPKWRMWGPAACPKCTRSVVFVILA